MSASDLRGHLRAHGTNSNAFLSLYPGFRAFSTSAGAIPYCDTVWAWVAAGEPLCAPERQLEMIREFTLAALREGKRALFVPVGSAFREIALSAGFDAVMIGSEPVFDLERYPRTGQTWTGVVPTARLLFQKGGRVTEFRPEQLGRAEKADLDGILRDWLASRKTAELGFLNQVRPWDLPADKKYFQVHAGGRVTAFLAAVPIWPRQAWYFIDLIRRGGSEAGTTELLVLESMRLLKEQGAREVTLGVSPLSNLAMAPPGDRHEKLYRLLSRVYSGGGMFYNFEPLYAFKAKFGPSRWEPVFLVCDSAGMGPRVVLGLISAASNGGVIRSAASGIARWARRARPGEALRARLAPGVVARSAPTGWKRIAWRLRFTLAAFLFLGALPGPRALDALALLLVSGLLEYFAGSLMAAVPFAVGFGMAYSLGAPPVLPGIAGCAGALGMMFRKGAGAVVAIAALLGAEAIWRVASGGRAAPFVAGLAALGLGAALMRARLRT